MIETRHYRTLLRKDLNSLRYADTVKHGNHAVVRLASELRYYVSVGEVVYVGGMEPTMNRGCSNYKKDYRR